MAGRSISWNTKSFVAKLDSHLKQRMLKAAIFLEGKVKQALSRGNASGLDPSQPGEPPKVQSGVLRASISNHVSTSATGIIASIGVTRGPASVYGARWELSKKKSQKTGEVETRPYLAPTLEKYKGTIYRIIVGG